MKKLLPLLTKHPGMPPQRFRKHGNEQREPWGLNVKCRRRDLIPTPDFFPAWPWCIGRLFPAKTLLHWIWSPVSESERQGQILWKAIMRMTDWVGEMVSGSEVGVAFTAGDPVRAWKWWRMCPRGCSCWIRQIPAAWMALRTHRNTALLRFHLCLIAASTLYHHQV